MEYVLIGIIVLIIAVIISSIKEIDDKEAMVIYRFGKYNRTIHAGWRIILPFIEKTKQVSWFYQEKDIDNREKVKLRAFNKIPLSETVYPLSNQQVTTKDKSTVGINAVVFMQIADPYVAVSQSENLYEAIRNLIEGDLLHEIGKLRLDEIANLKDFKQFLQEPAKKLGVNITRATINYINTGQAKQDLESQKKRQDLLEQAEVENKAADLTSETTLKSAKAQKEAMILKAQGEAEAKKIIAEAEASFITSVSNALTNSNVKCDPAKYLIALNYTNALKEMTKENTSKVVYLPYETMKMLDKIGEE